MKIKRVKNSSGMESFDEIYRRYRKSEIMPLAKKTSLVELCENVIPDRDGPWVNPVFCCELDHAANIGEKELCKNLMRYLEKKNESTYQMDILSIMSAMSEGVIALIFIVRIYHIPNMMWPKFDDFEDQSDYGDGNLGRSSSLIQPVRNSYSQEEIEYHKYLLQQQDLVYMNATPEVPFLNSISSYIPRSLDIYNPLDCPIYDLVTKDRQTSTITPYETFNDIFQQCMRYVTSVELDGYYNAVRGIQRESTYLDNIEGYINRKYVEPGLLRREDVHILREKLHRALFQLYIVQDLIDDPEVTDVKITSPTSIRCRIHGKAYMSNISFVDNEDYERFIKSLAIKNGIDLKLPKQTFTEQRDENYILRFTITASYITPEFPIIHVRKIPRKKLLTKELIEARFFDQKVRDYLVDCGKYSRGVVFAGPPGSGKTVALNWFIEEAYEDSAEILVIQENDELFCYRQGVSFEHVVHNPVNGEKPCTLEELGQMALVAGANVFVIGEAKGAEICSAITLSNSGCRTAITIHSPSAVETIDKMADLAMRGYAETYFQAVRMLKSFQTIVYIQDFKVQEITEITGYDEERHQMIYKYIYRNPG